MDNTSNIVRMDQAMLRRGVVQTTIMQSGTGGRRRSRCQALVQLGCLLSADNSDQPSYVGLFVLPTIKVSCVLISDKIKQIAVFTIKFCF